MYQHVIEIILTDNNLCGNIPPELGNFELLYMLRLGGNDLTGVIPPELGRLTNLSYLELWGNVLGGTVPRELGALGYLYDLDLGGNQVSGEIPPELGNLTSLVFLNLGGNQLEGGIPPSLGELRSLFRLELAGNRLGEAIPPELGRLSELRVLDVHGNQLRGPVPPELADLAAVHTLLIYLNALWAEDVALTTFLDALSPGWSHSQTVAPELLSVAAATDTSVSLSWALPVFTDGWGGYFVTASEVGSSSVFADGFEAGDLDGWSAGPLGKATTAYTVTGLNPGTLYRFEVRVYTEPNWVLWGQQNRVVSDPAVVYGSTLPLP